MNVITMNSLLKGLHKGQEVVSVNGVTLTFEGLSSDGNSFKFSRHAVDGFKVYDGNGVGSAIDPAFNICLTKTLALRNYEKSPQAAPKPKSPSGKLKRVEITQTNSPNDFIRVLLQIGYLSKFKTLIMSNNDKAVYKGLSMEGFPVFSVSGKRPVTTEFTWTGSKLHKFTKGYGGEDNYLLAPEGYEDIYKSNLFKVSDLSVGNTVLLLDGSEASILRIEEETLTVKSTMHGIVTYGHDGIPVNGKLMLTLCNVSKIKTTAPDAYRKYTVTEVSPGKFMSYKKSGTKITRNRPLGIVPKTKPVEVPVAESVPAPAPAPATVVEKVKSKLVAAIGHIGNLVALLQHKSEFLIVCEDGEIKKRFFDEQDAQFETTYQANQDPGKKFYMVKVSVKGVSFVPKPTAVFEAF